MKQRIYKYAIEFGKPINIKIDAKILYVGHQNGKLYLWALVNPDAHDTMRTFTTFGTGHPLEDYCSTETYIGTVQINEFVWHIFEEK